MTARLVDCPRQPPGMGIIHKATLSPSKHELVESWLPSRSWAEGHRIAGKVAEYRFDDPAGEVGVETILWRTEDGTRVDIPARMQVRGSGGDGEPPALESVESVSDDRDVTTVRAGTVEIDVARVVGTSLGEGRTSPARWVSPRASCSPFCARPEAGPDGSGPARSPTSCACASQVPWWWP